VKNTAKQYFVAAVACTLLNCSTSKESQWADNPELVNIILDSSFRIYQIERQMPKAASKVSEKIFPNNQQVGDSGDIFNETNNNAVYLPNKKFILGGTDSSNNYGYFVFESGSNPTQPLCILYSLKSGKMVQQVHTISVQKKVTNIQSLRAAILAKQYIKYTRSSY